MQRLVVGVAATATVVGLVLTYPTSLPPTPPAAAVVVPAGDVANVPLVAEGPPAPRRHHR